MEAPLEQAGAPAADARLLTPRFVRVTAANFFFFLTFASFFLLPLHVRALGGSERTIGLVMGTSGVAGLAAVLVIAAVLDRVGRRRFLLGGVATMAVASGAFLFVHAIGPALYTLRILQGVAFAAAFNAASTLAVAFAPATRRAAALGLFGVSTLTTHALAPALGELLIAVAGFPALFALAAGFSVIAFAIAWTVPEASPPEASHAGARLAPTREVLSALGTVCGCGVAFGAVVTYVPTFTRDARLGPVALFFLAYTAAAVMSRVLGGGLGDTRGHRPVIVAALALFTLSVVALAGARSPLGLAGAGLLFGAAQGIVSPRSTPSPSTGLMPMSSAAPRRSTTGLSTSGRRPAPWPSGTWPRSSVTGRCSSPPRPWWRPHSWSSAWGRERDLAPRTASSGRLGVVRAAVGAGGPAA